MSELALALVFAVLIWWFSTGIVLLLNRMSRGAITLSLVLSSLLGMGALAGLAHTAHQTSIAGAYCAFTCALLAWGWGLHPAMWRMGLGTEIGHAVLALAFERLKADHVWCKVMNGNEPSAKLAKRIGLRHLKSHPDYPTLPGRSDLVEFYALSASDYFDLAY